MTNRRKTWEKAFLSALEKTGIVTWAAKAAGVGRRTVYDHLNADPDFAEKWEEALDSAEARLEEEVMRRALEGEQIPVYYKGKVVGHKTRKSDTLLMFAIKNLQRRRERERDVPKAPSLRQFLSGGAPTVHRRRAAESAPAPAPATTVSVMERLPDRDVTELKRNPKRILRAAAATALRQRARSRPTERFGSGKNHRRGAERLWKTWASRLSAFTTAPSRRPLMAH